MMARLGSSCASGWAKFITEEEHPPEEFDMFGLFNMYIVSIEDPERPGEELQAVGFPRAYLLIRNPGWWIIYKKNGGTSLP
jgi:hypothetical protein